MLVGDWSMDIFLNGSQYLKPSSLTVPMKNLQVHDWDYTTVLDPTHFGVAIIQADFSSDQLCQTMIEPMFAAEQPALRRVVYVSAPLRIQQKHLDFAKELGSDIVLHGANRDLNLKDYLVSLAKKISDPHSSVALDQKIARLISAGQKDVLAKLAAKDRIESASSPGVLQAMVRINSYLGRRSLVRYARVRLGSKNTEDYHSRFMLGRSHIRVREFSEGVSILQPLEEIHNINSERILDIADGFVGLDDVPAANQYIDLGESLVGTTHDRVSNLRCKALVMKGHLAEGLDRLNRDQTSKDMTSFLNSRAVRLVKERNFQDAMRLYRCAIEIAPNEDLLHAKIYYNMALAELGMGQKLAAIDLLCRAESLGKASGFTKPTEKLNRIDGQHGMLDPESDEQIVKIKVDGLATDLREILDDES